MNVVRESFVCEGKVWKLAHGRYWSPADWKLLQELGLLKLSGDANHWLVSDIVERARTMRERSFTTGISVGIAVGMTMLWVFL